MADVRSRMHPVASALPPAPMAGRSRRARDQRRPVSPPPRPAPPPPGYPYTPREPSPFPPPPGAGLYSPRDQGWEEEGGEEEEEEEGALHEGEDEYGYSDASRDPSPFRGQDFPELGIPMNLPQPGVLPSFFNLQRPLRDFWRGGVPDPRPPDVVPVFTESPGTLSALSFSSFTCPVPVGPHQAPPPLQDPCGYPLLGDVSCDVYSDLAYQQDALADRRALTALLTTPRAVYLPTGFILIPEEAILPGNGGTVSQVRRIHTKLSSLLLQQRSIEAAAVALACSPPAAPAVSSPASVPRGATLEELRRSGPRVLAGLPPAVRDAIRLLEPARRAVLLEIQRACADIRSFYQDAVDWPALRSWCVRVEEQRKRVLETQGPRGLDTMANPAQLPFTWAVIDAEAAAFGKTQAIRRRSRGPPASEDRAPTKRMRRSRPGPTSRPRGDSSFPPRRRPSRASGFGNPHPPRREPLREGGAGSGARAGAGAGAGPDHQAPPRGRSRQRGPRRGGPSRRSGPQGPPAPSPSSSSFR